jgi:streptogramin lyase
MAHNRARIVVGLLTTFLWGFSPAAAEEPARQLRIEKEFPQTADYMCVGFGSLWMMSDRAHPKLLRIALADDAVTEIPVEGATGEFHRTTLGEGAVWVSDNHSQTIYKIDPKTNLIVMRIPADFRISPEAGEIGVGEGAVWAITGGFNDVLRRYSAQTGVEQATIPLPSPAAPGVVVDFGSIWIAGSREVELYRLDPATNRIVATTDLHSRPVALASGEGSVWVRQVDGTVQRFDGSSGKLIATFATGAADNSGEIVVGGGFVWINSRSVALMQIDPQTNSQRSRFDSPRGAFIRTAIAYGGGSLWLGGSAVIRIKLPE